MRLLDCSGAKSPEGSGSSHLVEDSAGSYNASMRSTTTRWGTDDYEVDLVEIVLAPAGNALDRRSDKQANQPEPLKGLMEIRACNCPPVWLGFHHPQPIRQTADRRQRDPPMVCWRRDSYHGRAAGWPTTAYK